VMAMLRLPTKDSDGKANMHLGAVGVGIDISKGETTYIAYKNRIIDEVPGAGPIRGLKIPYWDDILMIASKCQLITNLGYMAVDIAIDKTSGPVLIEINARAGLAVQIANLAPLKKRLQRIEGVKVTTPIKGVRIAKDMFGNVVEKGIHQVSGKTLVGAEEIVERADNDLPGPILLIQVLTEGLPSLFQSEPGGRPQVLIVDRPHTIVFSSELEAQILVRVHLFQSHSRDARVGGFLSGKDAYPWKMFAPGFIS